MERKALMTWRRRTGRNGQRQGRETCNTTLEEVCNMGQHGGALPLGKLRAEN